MLRNFPPDPALLKAMRALRDAYFFDVRDRLWARAPEGFAQELAFLDGVNVPDDVLLSMKARRFVQAMGPHGSHDEDLDEFWAVEIAELAARYAPRVRPEDEEFPTKPRQYSMAERLAPPEARSGASQDDWSDRLDVIEDGLTDRYFAVLDRLRDDPREHALTSLFFADVVSRARAADRFSEENGWDG